MLLTRCRRTPKRTPSLWTMNMDGPVEPLEESELIWVGTGRVACLNNLPDATGAWRIDVVHKLVKGKRNIMQLNTSPAPCYRALRVFLCFPGSRSNFAEQGWSHPAAFLTRVSKDFSHSFFFFPQIFRLPCAHFSHATERSALQSFSSTWMNHCISMDNLRFQDSADPCEVNHRQQCHFLIFSGVWCLLLYCVPVPYLNWKTRYCCYLPPSTWTLLLKTCMASVSLSLHFCSIIIPVYPVSQEGHSVRFICFPLQHSQAEFQHRWALFLGLYYACSSLDELSKLTV